MTPTRSILALGVAALTLLLAACGGGGGDDTTPPAGDDNRFTQSGEWQFALPAAGSQVCYDFDAQAEVAGCTGNTWDLKVKAGAGGRSATLWTNSGTSSADGSGEGGAFGGPFDHTWDELQAWQNGSTDPVSGEAIPANVFLADSVASVFTGSNGIQSSAFEYGVTGAASDHSLYPNFRVFLITTDSSAADAVGTPASPVFALQVTGYYGGATGTASGHPSFRWVDRAAPGTVHTATVDASAGWVYYDLAAGAQSTEAGTWHIAFNRYNTKLNGGESGSGAVAGFVGKTPAGFYEADGSTPVAAKFTATTNADDTLAELGAGDIVVPANANAWKKDTTSSPLSPAYTGTYPQPLNYGWYTYYPTNAVAPAGLSQHMLSANDAQAALVRTGEGTGYARLRLANIEYAAATPAYTGQQTWTVQFDLQPSN